MTHICSIDFFRIIFCCCVILGHINRVFFPNADFQFSLHNMAVDAFFIISGVFLARSSEKIFIYDIPNIEKIKILIVKKISHLYPMFIFSLFFGIFFFLLIDRHFIHDIYKSLWSSFYFISGINNFPNIAVEWYVSALFWASLPIIFLLVTQKHYSVYIFFPIVIFLLLSFMYSIWGSLCLLSTPLIDGWFSAGVVKALCDICIGVEIFYFSPVFNKFANRLKLPRVTIAFIELLCTYLIIYCFTRGGLGRTDYLILFAFPILLTILLSRKEVIYHFSDKYVFQFIGKYTYSIYLMHIYPLRLLQKYFSFHESFLFYVVMTSVTFVFGIFCYHLQKWLFAKIGQIFLFPSYNEITEIIEKKE